MGKLTKNEKTFARRAMLTALKDGTDLENGMRTTLRRDNELFNFLFRRHHDPVKEEQRQAVISALAERVYNKLRATA